MDFAEQRRIAGHFVSVSITWKGALGARHASYHYIMFSRLILKLKDKTHPSVQSTVRPGNEGKPAQRGKHCGKSSTHSAMPLSSSRHATLVMPFNWPSSTHSNEQTDPTSRPSVHETISGGVWMTRCGHCLMHEPPREFDQYASPSLFSLQIIAGSPEMRVPLEHDRLHVDPILFPLHWYVPWGGSLGAGQSGSHVGALLDQSTLFWLCWHVTVSFPLYDWIRRIWQLNCNAHRRWKLSWHV